MSLYQCEECGCKENTACGFYWCNDFDSVLEKHKGRKLCSACAPTVNRKGEPTEFNGKWHGEFNRQYFPIGKCETNGDGNLVFKGSNVLASRANAIKVENE